MRNITECLKETYNPIMSSRFPGNEMINYHYIIDVLTNQIYIKNCQIDHRRGPRSFTKVDLFIAITWQNLVISRV